MFTKNVGRESVENPKHEINRRIPINKNLSPHSKNPCESRVFVPRKNVNLDTSFYYQFYKKRIFLNVSVSRTKKLPVRCFIVVSLAIIDEISIVKKLDLFWHFDESLKSCLDNKILWSLREMISCVFCWTCWIFLFQRIPLHCKAISIRIKNPQSPQNAIIIFIFPIFLLLTMNIGFWSNAIALVMHWTSAHVK